MSSSHKLYKVTKKVETRQVGDDGRYMRTTTYSLKRKDESFKAATLYNCIGPFVIIYKHYDDEGSMVRRNVHLVLDVGTDLVVLKPSVDETVEIMQGMRASLASREE